MTQTLALALELPTGSDAVLVLEALGRIALTFGALPVALLLLIGGYQWLVRWLDRDTELRAIRAAARARVERRKNAQARNLELQLDGKITRR